MGQKIKEVYIVHHSHTDVGYTDLQEQVIFNQVHNIRRAAALIKEGLEKQTTQKDLKWNCETWYCVEQFLKRASEEEKKDFWAEVRSGNIGLSANYLNFTDLTDCRYLDRKLAEMMDRKVIQTVTYAPNFISTVVMCGMLILFLSPSVGIINHVVKALGGNAVNFMAEEKLWRHIYVWSGVWQGMGWSSVIYFAALAGISPELHEAAICDGASKFQLIRYIDLPGIMPTATVLLIMSCGSILSVGFEKVFLLQNDLNKGVSQVISTYVYQVGLVDNNLSYSTAIGLFNSLVNAVLLVIVNKIADKLSGNSLW